MLPTTSSTTTRPGRARQYRDMPPPSRRRRKPRAKCFVLLPVLGALTLYAYVVLKHFRPASERQHTVQEWVDDDGSAAGLSVAAGLITPGSNASSSFTPSSSSSTSSPFGMMPLMRVV